MQNISIYKTAADLKIEQWEHDGLVALIGPLSRGEIRFNMATAHCGSVGCIGGWIAYNAGMDTAAYVGSGKLGPDLALCSPSLRPLFWPSYNNDDGGDDGWLANASEGARAIVNFLTLGAPRWGDVMREPA